MSGTTGLGTDTHGSGIRVFVHLNVFREPSFVPRPGNHQLKRSEFQVITTTQMQLNILRQQDLSSRQRLINTQAPPPIQIIEDIHIRLPLW
jgi:hypothetical protein